MSTFQQTIRPWLLTPRVARIGRTGRRGPTVWFSPAWFLAYAMFMAMFYMTAYALTLTWDFGVVFYVGAVYAVVAIVRRLRRRPAVV